MYTASADFQTKIKSNTRQLKWSGTITTVGGVTYDFNTDKDSPKGKIVSGSITRSISSQSLSIGTAYAGTLSMELILPGVSRYELYNGKISLSVSVAGASDIIPMGIYMIGEALQSADCITIKAYDNMILLDDVNVSPEDMTLVQSPYVWLTQLCTACSVTLGSTSAEIQALPNGSRKTGFADVVTDVKTWRDVLGYLATYLGAFAYIGRDGKLYLGTYTMNSVDTIPSSFRFSSELSDFRTTYDGIYGVYKNEGVQEYVPNTNTGGLVLDIGTNPFLQFSDETNRLNALGEIIDAWDGVYYVPYSSELPLVPTYDPGDVLTFIDNQASTYDYGAITEITYNIGGQMHVACSGDNPRLASAQDRFTKSIAGLSAEYSNGQEIGGKNFWLLHTENTDTLTVGSTKTQVAEIEWKQTTDVQRMGFMYTCELNVSATAVVNVEINVDDDVNYTFDMTEQKALLGKRTMNSTCGFDVTGKGTHSAKVYITAVDNPLIWSDLA
jgi:hypothetical protein